MPIRVRNTLIHGPFGIELSRKCRKAECFQREKTKLSLGDSLAHLRKSLLLNGAGEGNRTLVSALGRPHSTIEPHPLIV